MNQDNVSQLTVAPSGQYTLEAKKADLGVLGKLFGSRENAPGNIAGFILIWLVVVWTISLFYETHVPAGDILKIIVPLLALVMGYLFGKRP